MTDSSSCERWDADIGAMEPNPAEPVFETAPEPHLELLPALDEPKDGEEEAEEVEAEEPTTPRMPVRRRGDAGSPEALRAPDRRRPPADTRRGARARPAQGRGRRSGEATTDRVQPPARDVHHAQLHEGRSPAPRPDPGGEPRPDPRRREVRLQDGVQALDLRHLVDPPVGHPGARRAGPDDPSARARRRAGAPRHTQPPHPRAEAEP